MAPSRFGLALLACLLLAGCSFGAKESQEETADTTAYTGGRGLAIALTNEGEAPFRVDVRVIAAGGIETARYDVMVPPGRTEEKWWSLEPHTYDLRMTYQWEAGAHAASGQETKAVDLQACAEVSRVAWTFRQSSGTVGHSFDGKTCAVRG